MNASRLYGNASRLHGLDTLRAVAIVAVMIYHLQWSLPDGFRLIGQVGWMGVDLFFVLSGYLIGGQLLRPFARGEPLRVVDFYMRRAYRILPAFLVVLLLYFAVPAWREQPHLPAAWKLLTFTANLFMNFPKERAFSHVWSLCIEEHFYLVLPALVIWLMRKPVLWKAVSLIVAVVLFGICIRSWELVHVVQAPGLDGNDRAALLMKRLYYPTYSRLDGLVCGVGIALIQIFRPAWWARLARRPHLLLSAGLLIAGAATWLFRGAYPSEDLPLGIVFGFPLLSLGFGVVVMSAASGAGLLRVRIPGVQIMATLAFSLYLTHKEVVHVVHVLLPWTEENVGWRTTLIDAAACLAVAGLLYTCVERPFLLLRDRRSRKPASLSPGVEARLDPAL